MVIPAICLQPTVEDRERKHNEALAAVKDDLGRQLRVKDTTITKLHEENEQLRVNFDRANRERETSDVKLLQVTDTLKTEHRLVAEASSKLRQRICDAEDR